MLKNDSIRLPFAILSLQDSQGKTCFHVVFADKHIRFRKFSSVLDFVEIKKILAMLLKNKELSTMCRITNNVGNIRYSASVHWLGSCGNYHGFVMFHDVYFGIRALVKLLRTYIDKYGLTSVRSIILRYAPPSENCTESYISFVESYLMDYGLNPDFVEYRTEVFFRLCQAICYFETNFMLRRCMYNITLKTYEL